MEFLFNFKIRELLLVTLVGTLFAKQYTNRIKIFIRIAYANPVLPPYCHIHPLGPVGAYRGVYPA